MEKVAHHSVGKTAQKLESDFDFWQKLAKPPDRSSSRLVIQAD
jgi:hypothetical protein